MSIEHSPARLAFTVRHFCSAVGIGRSKFYQLVSSGEIKIVKCGSKTLITAPEAERFVASLERAAA